MTPSEAEKKARDYENSLTIQGANEGYTIPPIRQLKGNSESYRRAQAESQQNSERLTHFLGQFMQGNGRENRFANGIPAPGEPYESILGMYMEKKN